jgi:hypothetical protein
MLLSTFRHIRGIGKKTELALWKKGITTWDKYLKLNGKQLSLFDDNGGNPVESSVRAYEEGNTGFFAQGLPSSEYYRIAVTYPNKTIFLDIHPTNPRRSKILRKTSRLVWRPKSD